MYLCIYFMTDRIVYPYHNSQNHCECVEYLSAIAYVIAVYFIL